MASGLIKGLIPDDTYSVKVRAKNNNGEVSDWSRSVTFTVPSKLTDTLTNTYNTLLSGTISSGTSDTNLTLNGTTSPYSLFTELSGISTTLTGGVSDTSNGFILDTDGTTTRMKLRGTNGYLTFDGSNLAISGAVTATSGTFTGTVNASGGTFTGFITAGNMKLGIGVNSTNNGIYMNSTNYWYDTGTLVVSGADIKSPIIVMNAGTLKTSATAETTGGVVINSTDAKFYNTSGVAKTTISNSTGVITATDVNLTGTINATGGNFTGYVTGGTSRFGAGVQTGKNGIWLNATNYWYDDGTINATLGNIGGFTLSSTSLTSTNFVLNTSGRYITLGTGNTIVNIDAYNGIWLGNAALASAPFAVDLNGSIKATSGTIGGWTLSSTSLTAGTGSSSVGMSTSGYPFYAGNATPASAPFRVTSAGAVTAISGVIGGFSLSSTTITSSGSTTLNKLGAWDSSFEGGTYLSYWQTLTKRLIAGNPTFTLANPAVITLSSHGLITGDMVQFSTTGSLPTGLSPEIVYYVINAGASTFNISLTSGGAAISTLGGSQSGVHTANEVFKYGDEAYVDISTETGNSSTTALSMYQWWFSQSVPKISYPQITMYKDNTTKTRFPISDLGLSVSTAYTMSLDAKLSADNPLISPWNSIPITLRVRGFTSSTGGVATYTNDVAAASPLTSTSSWTRLSNTFTLPSGTTHIEFTFIENKEYTNPNTSSYSSTMASTTVIDNIQVEVGSSYTSYQGSAYSFELSSVYGNPVLKLNSYVGLTTMDKFKIDGATGAISGTSISLTGSTSMSGGLTVSGGSSLKGNVGLGTSSSNTISSYGKHYFKTSTIFTGTASFNGNVAIGNSAADSLTINSEIANFFNLGSGFGTTARTSSISENIAGIYVGSWISMNRSNGTPLYLKNYASGSSGPMITFYLNSTTTTAGGIATDQTTGPSWTAPSDYRLKENIQDYTGGINIIKKVKPKTFNFKQDEEKKNIVGFIAHEYAEANPDWVIGEKDAIDENGNPIYQNILSTHITPYLVAALKESIEKIEDLENRIAILENK